jgi:hypothetical protein
MPCLKAVVQSFMNEIQIPINPSLAASTAAAIMGSVRVVL